MSQGFHPPSVLLLLWSRGKDEDHTLPALRVCGGEHGGPQGQLTPAPEASTACSEHPPALGERARGMAVRAVTSWSEDGALCPRVGAGKEAGGRGAHRWCSDPGAPGVPLSTGPEGRRPGPAPESPLYSSSQSPDRGNPWSPDRGPGCQKRQKLRFSSVKNQISQSGSPGQTRGP